MKKSEYQRQEDEVKLLICEAKIRNNLTDEGLARKIGIPFSTLGKRKCHPGDFRMHHIWLIEQLAGRPLKGGTSQ